MITKILNYLKSTVVPFFKKTFQNFTFKDWLLLIVSILMLFFFFQARHLNQKLIKANNAFTTELSVYHNKADEEYAAKQLAILEVSELKNKNQELYQEIKNLRENPVVVTKIKTKFKVDTLLLETEHTVTPDPENPSLTQHNFNWHYSHPDNYYAIDGLSTVSSDFNSYSTTLNNLTVNSKFTVDLVDDKEHLNILVRSDNPYIDVSDINSVVIDPRKSPVIKKYFPQKRWGIGPSIGVGVDKNLHFTPYIGVSLNYNIISF